MLTRTYAQPPAAPIPPNTSGDSDRVHALRCIAERAKRLLSAQIASENACTRRGEIEAGASRARITTSNAQWMRAAEYRDRCQADLVEALRSAGLLVDDGQKDRIVNAAGLLTEQSFGSAAWTDAYDNLFNALLED